MSSGLQVRGLSAAYTGHDGRPRTVVYEADLELSPGTVVGLAGESGCGKSTLALAAIGYPQASILAGEALLNGTDLLRVDRSALRAVWGARIAYVAQSASLTLNPAIPVGRQLAQPLARHLGLRGSELAHRQVELLEAVALPNPERSLARYPHEFSGGQQQRIALALAVACDPEVLILDEPTTGLDVTTQAKITQLLKRLIADTNMAVLYVSHDVALLATVADRLLVMYAGRVVEEGPTWRLLRRPAHPYSKALLEAAPSAREPRAISPIPGRPPAAVIIGRCPFSPRCAYAIAACEEGDVPRHKVAEGHTARCLRAGEVQNDGLRRDRKDSGRVAVHGTLLEVSELVCRYGKRADAPAVDGVSFSLQAGETVGIVGESGSGKSTLLRAVAGLHRPLAGTLAFEGRPLPVLSRRDRDLRKSIQLIFQDPDTSLNPRHTIAEILRRPLRTLRPEVSRSQEQSVMLELLESVGLLDATLSRYPTQLSGGQKQRVAIARALAAKPRLLLCDEVTSALDVSVQAIILRILAGLARTGQFTVLFVSHDLAVVRTVCQRALVMQNGRICEQGDSDRLFTAPDHPYTRELLASLPDPAVA